MAIMNNSVNYSSFVEMVLDSSDDFEPYGYAETPQHHVISADKPGVGQVQQDIDKLLDE
jgi:hypothetical protein